MTRNAIQRAATVDAVTLEEMGVELGGAVSRLYRRLRAERSDGQLGDTASSVLAFLVKHGPHTLSALSEHERVTPPSMNQTVNTLARAGYVVRQQDPSDGRKVLLAATPQGVALTGQTRRRLHTWLNAQLAELTPEDRRTVLDGARILREMADS